MNAWWLFSEEKKYRHWLMFRYIFPSLSNNPVHLNFSAMPPMRRHLPLTSPLHRLVTRRYSFPHASHLLSPPAARYEHEAETSCSYSGQ